MSGHGIILVVALMLLSVVAIILTVVAEKKRRAGAEHKSVVPKLFVAATIVYIALIILGVYRNWEELVVCTLLFMVFLLSCILITLVNSVAESKKQTKLLEKIAENLNKNITE